MPNLPHRLYPSFEAGAEGSGNPGRPSGGPAEDYLRHVCEMLGTNWRFLNKNAREVLGEIADLLNEGITEYLGLVLNRPNREEEFVRRAMFYFVIHVLLPMSSALWLDALSGNLPACFVETRIILESLAKCYLADLKHGDKATFWERIEALEGDRREFRSISEMMREVDRDLGVQKMESLWKKLSEHWVHAKGIMRRIVEEVERKERPPSWALVIPMELAESDLGALRELKQTVAELREVLKAAMKKYAQWLQDECMGSQGSFA